MPLEIYERGKFWWFKGRIDRIPSSKPYRQSSRIPTTLSEEEAKKAVAVFEHQEIKRHYVGEEKSLTFSEAVLIYDASPEMANDLIAVLSEIGETPVAKITPQQVQNLARTLYPKNSTDSWQRHVVTPVRAVISNAHSLGKCPSIRIQAFTTKERLKQDRLRGKKKPCRKSPWRLALDQCI